MNPPVVKQRTVSSAGGSTRVIAVMPFATRPGLVAVGSDAGMTSKGAGGFTARRATGLP